ncbi:hypothetical protein ACFV0C_24835 [Streptomyces sp. NPDC059568]|uniref:hypothetical protein n=1 Tax=Streptomyces sp. NPDC059568 TaxID=3346868 RepID=UPI0036A822C8
MTIVIDTKNEMKRSVDGLGNRVSDLERDLRAAFSGEITALRENALTDLKSSQHETRTSAYNAGKRASEAVAAVTDLRRDVDRLREDVGKILEILRSATPVPAVGAPDGPSQAEARAGGTIGPESALPGQGWATEEESGPTAVVDTPSEAETPATSTTGGNETGQPVPGADAKTTPEAEDREEREQDVPRAALEASEQNSGEPALEPSPSYLGRKDLGDHEGREGRVGHPGLPPGHLGVRGGPGRQPPALPDPGPGGT